MLKKRFLRVTLVALCLCHVQSLLASDPVPRYFSATPGALLRAKVRLGEGDKTVSRAVKNLVKDADKLMAVEPPSVVEKSQLPPSGDKHDYISLAPYFWPDPKKQDGLPYVRHDGKLNPESRDPAANDGPRLKLLRDAIEDFSLAYYFTGQEAYAERAATFARVWFLDPKTRMTPHLKYAQAVRGANDGRGVGILEGRHIAFAVDALGLLSGSKAWSANDQTELNAWLSAYLDWLQTSAAGKEERVMKNNHGSFFDAQLARIALCLGDKELASNVLEGAKQNRIATQIEPDGTQPLEFSRTASFSYAWFNLEALGDLATLGEHIGVDLWHYTTSDNRGIRAAIDYMLAYVDIPAKAWPLEQIKETREESFLPVLRQAAVAYGSMAYEAVIAKYPRAVYQRFQLVSAAK